MEYIIRNGKDLYYTERRKELKVEVFLCELKLDVKMSVGVEYSKGKLKTSVDWFSYSKKVSEREIVFCECDKLEFLVNSKAILTQLRLWTTSYLKT